MNPLLEKFNTEFETAPFDKIKNEHFLPAIKEAINIAKENINKIKANTEEPSFENTIEALEYSSEKVGLVSEIFFNLNSAETSDEIQKIAKDISPLLTEFHNDIILDLELFKKVNKVHSAKSTLSLSTEENTLLEKTYKSFVRNGANLNDSDKEKLREIDKEKSMLALEFGENVLAETNKYELVLDNIDDLNGLTEDYIEMSAHMAKEKDYEGKWLVTLDYPSYIPFMTYAENRDLRKELFFAFSSKCIKKDKLDNQEIVKKIALLRHKRANLLGYKTHAEYVLEERMATSAENVNNFLAELLKYSKPAAEANLKELTEFSKNLDGLDVVERWDSAYYSEKLKKEKYDIDDNILKPYFKLEDVINGVFIVAKKLFGLTYTKIDSIAKYHEDVETYKVTDEEGNYVGIFYADFFPRPGKRGGAWMTSYKGQKLKDGINHRPHVSIVCNFTKPTPSKPSLLTFNEVETLFHEFGHSLHGILADGKYESVSGTNVYWDFVELPSQILENWASEKECLDLFAKHYETGENIPQELIKKIKDSANHLSGMASLRQVSFGLLDMAWHNKSPKGITDVVEFENATMAPTSLMPKTENTNMSCSFSHIFNGGYSSGYYSYKWAEVLDADAFEYFKQEGIFNKEVADSFKKYVLSAGGSEHPMTLYKKFRGQEPDIKALLRRSGLI